MKIKIASLPGDGIGPEVVDQARKALDAVAYRFDHQIEYEHGEVGASAIDKTGNPLPDETLALCIESDAILFGAIGHPKYDNDPNAKVRPEQGLLKLRKELGLYANLRPVASYDKLLHLSPLKEEKVKGVDLLIMRELTGGIYFGKSGRKKDGSSAYDTCTYTIPEIQRIAKLAFESAQKRRKKVTLVDKANVLETSRLWRNTVREMAGDYPDVELDFMYVDNAAMQLIQYPLQFDVMLTSNLFGDILSDEASVLTGSMGLLPSASIGKKTSLFEPIHGSYPQAAGEDIANPMATILSAAMLLDSLNLTTEAHVVRLAVQHILEKGIGTPEIKPAIIYSCSQVGDMVATLIEEAEKFAMYNNKIHQGISTII
jgi:3-isopropylmalate dehydrogenase